MPKQSSFRCTICYKGLNGLRGLDRHKCQPSNRAPQRKRATFKPFISSGPAEYEIPVPEAPIEGGLMISGEKEYNWICDGQETTQG